jgi:hypothetical protein
MLQLDKTHIAIRERSFIDVLDLALCVLRAYARQLVPILAAGVVPMMLVNHWLLSASVDAGLAEHVPATYTTLLLLLVFIEVPFATAPATVYLGQAVFAERPEIRRVFTEAFRSLPQLLLYQGLLRVLFLRWLYLNEVILLDRNPVRRKSGVSNTTFSRGRQLHRGEGVDVFGRWFATASIGAVLFLAIWFSIFLVRAFFLSRWEWDVLMQTFYLQLALWVVIGYFAVVRFLCYLDLRIRREGWEVELAMRAEGDRLTRQWQ